MSLQIPEIHGDSEPCNVCGAPLSGEENALHFNCGGTCRECMAMRGDYDCIWPTITAYLDEFYARVRREAEVTLEQIAQLQHESPDDKAYAVATAEMLMNENMRTW